ncbi:ECF transporter S component [Clostridium sp. JN-9]|uniref:ECF transporter S component n=1 Tax=Clostridium sp. JN-9 TaxID=2507159 RepID=UPI000FFE13C0|nr:ECF transporter S component [Clostridium sp. JN-9]QAT38905.1 ECF transporter S component [Clostridium sp. JN-9]
MDKNLNKLIRTSLFLALAIVIQIMGKNFPEINQFLVGPVINAILILTAFMCGTAWGVSLGVLTPVLAWLTGQLAAPLAPFIPFIMIGNAIFVIFYGSLRNYKSYGKYIGIASGAFFKYLFLSLSASKLVNVFKLAIPKKIADKLVVVMGTPQLITALIGGFLAVLLIEILKKRNVHSIEN